VVKINGNDFNKDMDDYLNKRRSQDDSSIRFMDSLKEKFQGFKIKRKQRLEEDEYNVRSSGYEDSDFEEDNDESFEEEVVEEPVTAPRRSLISWLFRRRNKKPVVEDDWEEDEVVKEPSFEEQEYREAIKILHRWVEKLDHDTLNQFKRSPDFEKYKETLKKLNMIK
jgi:hypothetical protein